MKEKLEILGYDNEKPVYTGTKYPVVSEYKHVGEKYLSLPYSNHQWRAFPTIRLDRDLDVFAVHGYRSSGHAYSVRTQLIPIGVSYTVHTVTAVDASGRPTQTTSESRAGLDNFRTDSRLVGNYLSMTGLSNSTVSVGYQYIAPTQVNGVFNNPDRLKLIKKVDYKKGGSFRGRRLDFTPTSGYFSRTDGTDYYYPMAGPFCNGGTYELLSPTNSAPEQRMFKEMATTGGITVGQDAEFFLVMWGNELTNLRGSFSDVPLEKCYDIGNYRDDLMEQLYYDNIYSITSQPNRNNVMREINSLSADINSHYRYNGDSRYETQVERYRQMMQENQNYNPFPKPLIVVKDPYNENQYIAIGTYDKMNYANFDKDATKLDEFKPIAIGKVGSNKCVCGAIFHPVRLLDVEYWQTNESNYYDTSNNGITYNGYMLEAITTDEVAGYTDTADNFNFFFGPQVGTIVDTTNVASYVGFDATNVLANGKYLFIETDKDGGPLSNNQTKFVSNIRMVDKDHIDRLLYWMSNPKEALKNGYSYGGRITEGTVLPVLNQYIYMGEMRPKVWQNERVVFDANPMPAGQYIFLDAYCERYNTILENTITSTLKTGHQSYSYYMKFNLDYNGMYKYDKVCGTETWVISDTDMNRYPGSNISNIRYEFGYSDTPTDVYHPCKLNSSVSAPGIYEVDGSRDGGDIDESHKQVFLFPISSTAWTLYQGHGPTYYRKSRKVGNVYSTESTTYPKDSTEPFDDGYMYEYIGEMLTKYTKDMAHPIRITSQNRYTYPENGIIEEDGVKYGYVYEKIQKRNIMTYYPNVISGHMMYRQSAGTSTELALGAVGGASITMDVFKPLVDVLPYIDHEAIAYYQYEDQPNYISEGLFTIKGLTENGLSKTTITMYDNVERLKKDAYPLLKQIVYPIHANELFCLVCEYCNIPYDVDQRFLNEFASISQLPENVEDITCFDVMTGIAQISCSIIVADVNGYLVIKDVSQPQYSRGSNVWNTNVLDSSMIPIQKPTSVQYKKGEDFIKFADDGVDDVKTLDLSENPFTFNNSDDDVAEWLNNILTKVASMGDVYYGNVNIPNNIYGMECGDSWVICADGIEPRRGIISDKSISGSGVSFVSSGDITSISHGDKAYTDEEINAMINRVNSNFERLDVRSIVIMDTVLGVTNKSILVNITFQPGFTNYVGEGMDFDIGPELTALMFGERANIIFNKHKAVAQGVNGDLVIQDPLCVADALVPDTFRFEYKDVPEEIEATDGEIGTIQIVYGGFDLPGIEDPYTTGAYFEFYPESVDLKPEEYADALTSYDFSCHGEEMGAYMAYLVSDGAGHNCTFGFNYFELNNPLKGKLYFRLGADVFYDQIDDVRVKYNHNERKLYFEITFVDKSQYSALINSVTNMGDSATLTLLDENNNPIQLPYSITSDESSWVYVYRGNEYLGRFGFDYYNHQTDLGFSGLTSYTVASGNYNYVWGMRNKKTLDFNLRDNITPGDIVLNLEKYAVIKEIVINGKVGRTKSNQSPTETKSLLISEYFDDHLIAEISDGVWETYGRIVYNSRDKFRIIPNSGYTINSQTFVNNVLTLEIE